jgi:WhiB family redox-sensing transcriptional regulator
MWNPADNLNWQENSSCSKPENKKYINWFFSSNQEEKYKARNLCHECPVRKDCLQWALEHRQIWGVWGGRDEVDIRRALSVSYSGEEIRRKRFPNCPFCSARPDKLKTEIVDIPGGGRWTTAKIAVCSECNFSWRSRTSSNAINLYHEEKELKLKKKREKKEEEKSNPPHKISDKK